MRAAREPPKISRRGVARLLVEHLELDGAVGEDVRRLLLLDEQLERPRHGDAGGDAEEEDCEHQRGRPPGERLSRRRSPARRVSSVVCFIALGILLSAAVSPARPHGGLRPPRPRSCPRRGTHDLHAAALGDVHFGLDLRLLLLGLEVVLGEPAGVAVVGRLRLGGRSRGSPPCGRRRSPPPSEPPPPARRGRGAPALRPPPRLRSPASRCRSEAVKNRVAHSTSGKTQQGRRHGQRAEDQVGERLVDAHARRPADGPAGAQRERRGAGDRDAGGATRRGSGSSGSR